MLLVRGRRDITVDARAMVFLRHYIVDLRRRVVAAMNDCRRRRDKRERIRIDGRTINCQRVVEERGRLVNPSIGFFRVAVHACHDLCHTRRYHSCHAGVLSFVLNVVRGATHVHVSVRLLQVRLVLNGILRVGLTRVARSNVRHRGDGICAFSFRALRRLTTRVGSNDKDYRDPFILNGSDLRAFNVFLFCQAASRAKRQDLSRHVRYFLRLIIETIVRRARNASTKDNIIGRFNRRKVVIAGVGLIASASLANEVCRRVPRTGFLVRLTRRGCLSANANLFLVSVRAHERGFHVVGSGRVFVVGVIRSVLRCLIFGLAY